MGDHSEERVVVGVEVSPGAPSDHRYFLRVNAKCPLVISEFGGHTPPRDQSLSGLAGHKSRVTVVAGRPLRGVKNPGVKGVDTTPSFPTCRGSSNTLRSLYRLSSVSLVRPRRDRGRNRAPVPESSVLVVSPG